MATTDPINLSDWYNSSMNHKLMIDKILNTFSHRNKSNSDDSYRLSLKEMFECQVSLTPEKIAMRMDKAALSYSELNEKANQLANKLLTQGIKSGSVVGILVEPSIEMLVAILGIIKSGAAYLPINPEYPKDRIEFMLDDAKASVLLTKGTNHTSLEFDGISLSLYDQTTYSDNTSNPSNTINESDLACLFYTSGTTGQPKGVMVEHQGIALLVKDMDFIRFSKDDKIAQVSNLAFDGATFEIWGGLLNGLEVVIIDKNNLLSPQKLLDKVIENHITIMFFTPALFNILVNECIEIYSFLKTVVIGGDVADQQKILQVLGFSKNIQIVNGYGPTETVTFSISCDLSIDLIKKSNCVPIGKPLLHTEIYILDENMQPVPIGEKGEIYIGGRKISKGYLNNEKLTAEKFIDNPFLEHNKYAIGKKLYKTGDLGRWLSDGNIEFCGRKDNQVKIRGFRIETEEIKRAILEFNGIHDCVIVPKKDIKTNSTRLAAYITVDNKNDINKIKKLRTYLSLHLPDYMVPSTFTILDKIPLNHNLKVNISELPEPEFTNNTEEYIPPRNELETNLCEIWKKIFEKERISINDDFFHLGGDSLMVMQMISMASAYDIDLDIATVMEHRTIASMVEHIKKDSLHNNEIRTVDLSSLSPIENWFFSQKFSNPNMFNQTVSLNTKISLKKDLINKTFYYLIQAHQALSFRYQCANGTYERRLSEANHENFDYCLLVDLTSKSSEEIEKLKNEFSLKVQENIDIEKGTLIQAILFVDNYKNSQELFIAIHHLVVDAMSWRIFLEDFENIYLQVSNNLSHISLPKSTLPYSSWVSHLSGKENLSSIDFWKTQLPSAYNSIPKDFDRGANNESSSRNIGFEIDEKTTRKLLTTAVKYYAVPITEILLLALSESFNSFIKKNELSIDLELHGRSGFSREINLSRTLGWFTTIFPFKINTNNLKSYEEKLQKIHIDLGKCNPTEYGVIKYMSNGKTSPDFEIEPEVSFNYLGQWKTTCLQNSFLSFKENGLNLHSSPHNKRPHLIDIAAQVINEKMKISFNYSTNHHKHDTIKNLTSHFEKAIYKILSECKEDAYIHSDAIYEISL